MELKPIKRYVPPRYPTHDILFDHPELLRFVPKRWRGNRLALATLSIAASLIFSRISVAAEPQTAEHRASPVAPLFVHGQGSGTFGCIAVSPPQFFSEAEARRIIGEEAAIAGLNFLPDALTLTDADVPLTYETKMRWRPDGYSLGHIYPGSVKSDLPLDGYDAAHNIGFVFVSGEDFRAWKNKDFRNNITVDYVDIKETAERLRDNLARQNCDPVIAVFYDPMPKRRIRGSRTVDNQGHPIAQPPLAADELRAQVCDFILWLKAQGII